ncbi:unnamed protein product, partial [Ectocarpus sp. 12 AP-2014]
MSYLACDPQRSSVSNAGVAAGARRPCASQRSRESHPPTWVHRVPMVETLQGSEGRWARDGNFKRVGVSMVLFVTGDDTDTSSSAVTASMHCCREPFVGRVRESGTRSAPPPAPSFYHCPRPGGNRARSLGDEPQTPRTNVAPRCQRID